MDWIKVITDPLGIAGYALALVFGITGRIISQKGKRNAKWVAPTAFAFALVCIIGGLTLAYSRGVTPLPVRPKPASDQTQSMHIDKIDQKGNGAAVAGVQGNVTVNAPSSQTESKPKK